MKAKKVIGYVATMVLVLSVIGVLVFKFYEYKAFKTIKTSTS